MKNKKIVRPLIVSSENLNEILDSRVFNEDEPEDADYCFQLRASKYAMRNILKVNASYCTVLNNGHVHPMACGTPHCMNWKSNGNCSMIIAQIRDYLGPNDKYLKAFDEKKLPFQCNWPDATPPELVFVVEEKKK